MPEISSITGWHGSSTIKAVEFETDPPITIDTGTLTITFLQGDPYIYAHVPQSVFMALDAAKSPGQYHATHIRGKYPFARPGSGA